MSLLFYRTRMEYGFIFIKLTDARAAAFFRGPSAILGCLSVNVTDVCLLLDTFTGGWIIHTYGFPFFAKQISNGETNILHTKTIAVGIDQM